VSKNHSFLTSKRALHAGAIQKRIRGGGEFSFLFEKKVSKNPQFFFYFLRTRLTQQQPQQLSQAHTRTRRQSRRISAGSVTAQFCSPASSWPRCRPASDTGRRSRTQSPARSRAAAGAEGGVASLLSCSRPYAAKWLACRAHVDSLADSLSWLAVLDRLLQACSELERWCIRQSAPWKQVGQLKPLSVRGLRGWDEAIRSDTMTWCPV